jgi:spermidine synthase
MLVLIFGSTHFAVSTVLTAFMTGLALGAYVLGRQIDRRWNPLVVYGFLEIGIGAYALAVPGVFGLLEPVSRWLWRTFSPDFYAFSALRFAFVGAVLVPPTALMGGTLPVLSRFLTRRRERIGLSVGRLYGVNTFGSVAGTALAGFLLVPSLGVRRTVWIAAALNVAVGAAALLLARWTVERGAGAGPAAPREPVSPAGTPAPWEPARTRMVLAAFALSGFVAMLYEIAWTRVLALILGSSVYAFTIMLATFLMGLAAGATAMSRLADRLGARLGPDAVAAVLAAAGATAFGTLALFHRLPYLFWASFHRLIGPDPSWTGRALLFAVEFLLAALVMLPPTLFLGGMFPLVVRICGEALPHVGRTAGTAYASNTVGTILGSALGGFVAIPLLGIQGCVVAAVILDLALAAALLAVRAAGSRPRAVGAALCGAAAAAVWFVQPPWNVLVMNSGIYQYAHGAKGLTPEGFVEDPVRRGEPVFYKEGVTATVMVSRNPRTGDLSLSVDGKVDASSSGDLHTQLLLGHVPMLLAEDPRDVLVIGYGSGITVGAVTTYPVESVTAVEIESAVIEGSKAFSAHNHDPASNPKVEIVAADGRNFLLVAEERYDVITSEPSNPWRTVASNLFTREFYELARRRLKPGGLFCAWLQLYALPPDLLRAQVRSFASAFPNVSVYMPTSTIDLILIGSEGPVTPDVGRIRARMAAGVAADLARIRVESEFDLLTYLLLGDEETRAFAGDGPLNTDDNALIEFRSPLFVYTATHLENSRALVAHMADPLAGARGIPPGPGAAAAAYTGLGRAFFGREMVIPALAALRKAQALHPTAETAALMAEYDQWMRLRAAEGR